MQFGIFLSSLTPTKFSFYKSQIKYVMIYMKSHLADDWLLRLEIYFLEKRNKGSLYCIYNFVSCFFKGSVCQQPFFHNVLYIAAWCFAVHIRNSPLLDLRLFLSSWKYNCALVPFLQISLPVLDDFPRINSYNRILRQREWSLSEKLILLVSCVIFL